MGKEHVLTAPLRSAVSGDVPAHSCVSAPCGVGYANMSIKILLDAPNELVDNDVKCRRQLKGALWRLAMLRPISVLAIPI